MKITKIIYKDSNDKDKAITECDVVLDDVLKLRSIKLYVKNGEYYLTFPSIQDIARNFMDINFNVKGIVTPDCLRDDRPKEWEEFYYPVSSVFYAVLRDTIAKGYDFVKLKSNKTYIPK